MQETSVQSLGWKDSLGKGKATHSSILAWEISWAEEPGKLLSMESQRVRHNLATKQQLGDEECVATKIYSESVKLIMPT